MLARWCGYSSKRDSTTSRRLEPLYTRTHPYTFARARTRPYTCLAHPRIPLQARAAVLEEINAQTDAEVQQLRDEQVHTRTHR